MASSKLKKAKALVGIPIAVLVIGIACFALSMVLEKPTDRGTVYSVVSAVWLFGLFLAPIPCFVMSLVGTVMAANVKKSGEQGANGTVILGVMELLIAVGLAVLAVLMFIGGQGVKRKKKYEG